MRFFQALLIFSLVLTPFQVCWAKTSLPITIRCKAAGPTRAELRVAFGADARDVTITVVGTGAVGLPRTVRRLASCTKDQVVVLPLSYPAPSGEGGVAVEIRGDFGHGGVSEVRALSLTSSGSVRAKQASGAPASAAPAVILVPAKTTKRKRP